MTTHGRSKKMWRAAPLLALLVVASAARAIVPPEPPAGPAVAARQVADEDLAIANHHRPLRELPAGLATQLKTALAALGVPAQAGFYDLRGGVWGTLVLGRPLVPGPGVGNTLTWLQLGIAAPADDAQYKAAVWRAFRSFLAGSRAQLRVDPAELPTPRLSLYGGRRLVQIHAQRVVAGVPVRDSFVTAAVNSGNLVLYGTRNWGAIDVPTQPALAAAEAKSAVAAHLAPLAVAAYDGDPRLELIPLENGDDPAQVAAGHGYRHRLAWVVRLRAAGDAGAWEALVDAASGEVFAFYDANQYAERRRVTGGVLPVSNDGGVPDGVEQAGYPMPFATLQLASGGTATTSSGGVADVDGAFTATLSGPFVNIVDNCGAVTEKAACTDLDLGTGGGTDCAVPAGHSPGDTHAARTGFYEVNRIIEQAKGWNPTAGVTARRWLDSQLTSNMNIINSCNAFFDPVSGTINFYRSGAAGANRCRNTGEIAAVFDHEWGHGLDWNDTSAGISSPGEAYADITAILRLNTSCIGRGFWEQNARRADRAGLCDGFGDLCTECSGVREDDWRKHLSGQPHGIDWVNAACGAIVPVPLQAGPCARGTHCEGTIVGEAFWDLVTRDLRCNGTGWENVPGTVGGGRCTGGAAPAIDRNTALEIVARLFYQGASNVHFWYQCAPPVGGCNADGGYFQLLAADDDDGTLLDGTPHMKAIFAAFDRHQLACPAPLPQNLGCLATPAPAQAPTVTAAPAANGAQLSWNAVPGAAAYWVFRTEGVLGCNFGKQRIATVTGTSFSDSGLLDGRTYYYSVVPVGGLGPLVVDACSGPMSACASVVPLSDGQPRRTDCPVENGAPTATDDAATTPRNRPRTIDVLANDSDPNSDPLAVANVTDPANGSAAIDAGGTVTYTPDAGFEGEDAFDYTVADGRGGSDVGRVTVAVGPDACVAPGITLLTDPVGDASTGLPEHDVESLALGEAPGGKLVFTFKMQGMTAPPPSTTWPVTFRSPSGQRFVKMATDALGAVRFAHGAGSDVSVAGTAADPASGYGADGTIRIVVARSALGNLAAGQKLDTFLTRIRVELGAGNALTPDNMPDSLAPAGAYEVTECGGQAPVAADDEAQTELDTPVAIAVLANDADPGGQPLAVGSVGQPAHGTAAAGADGRITYTPARGFLGMDGFTYSACDSEGLCDSAAVAVAVTCPAAATGRFTDDFEPAPEAGWTVQTAANALPLSAAWRVVSDPFARSATQAYASDGITLDLKDDRLVAPPQDLSASSRLTFWHRFELESAYDGGVLEVSTDGGATWVDVLAGGGAFVEGGYNGTVSAADGSPIAGRRAWTGSSTSLDAMERVVVDLGAFAGRGVRLRWRLAADPLAAGSQPGLGWWIDDVEVTNTLVTPATCPLAPRAADDAAATQEGAAVDVDVLANDEDPNGEALTVGAVTPPAQGGTVANHGTHVTYTPAPGFSSPPADTFTYTACDPGGLCDEATVTVTVAAVNHPPAPADDAATTRAGTPVRLDVLANDADPDGDTLSLAGVGAPEHGTAVDNGDGTVTYTPEPGFAGADRFDYTASDGELTATATVRVTVEEQPAPGQPRKVNGSGSIGGGSSFGLNAHAGAAPPQGRIRYEAGGAGPRLKGTVLSTTFSSETAAGLAGPCELADGTSCTWEADLEDNGEPGAGSDRFSIRVYDALGNLVHQAGGTLTQGNVNIH